MSGEEEDMCLARKIVSILVSKGIKLLAFDFDLTLVTVHTAGMWKQGTPKLIEYFRPCFSALIQAALRSDLEVCVVTYSLQPMLIRDVLKGALPKYDTRQILIRANTREWLQGSSSTSLGKEEHIAYIVTKLANKKNAMIRPEEILLIDDDTQNINIAKRFGHMTYQVEQDRELTIAEILDFVSSMTVSRTPPATPTEDVNPLADITAQACGNEHAQ